MSAGRRIAQVVAGAAGVAVAGTAVSLTRRRRIIARRGAGDTTAFGSLRSEAITVVADDGVPLHVEIDELDPARPGEERPVGGAAARPPVTLVFAHGYALNLDCWHFQRAGYRGQIRAVYYDQRSHGRSGRSPRENATIDQLGRDLVRILEDVTHDEPVVLIGHSMGGMTILSLADQFPELFGTKVVATALISTTAGGLDPAKILFPMIPSGLSGGIVAKLVGGLTLGHKAVDRLRRAGTEIATVVTDRYAFGSDVPESYVRFVFQMLDRTPFEVVGEFFPAFADLDKWKAADTLSKVPTTIMCGTADKLTSIGHSRKLHSRIAGSDLIECPGAGHMVILERHEEVNAALDDVISHALRAVEAR